MTRKDYIALAASLRRIGSGTTDDASLRTFFQCVSAVADALQSDNPRFDRAKFLEACGACGADRV